MQLLTCQTQLTGVERSKIGAFGCFSFPDETFQRFGGTVEGFPKFIQNPGKRSEIIDDHIKLSRVRFHCIGLHKIRSGSRNAEIQN